MAKRARVMQGNGYYPSHIEIESASDGDAKLRVRDMLGLTNRSHRGTLWERVADRENQK